MRLKRQDEAIESLARAVELERDRVRYAYVYAIALNSTGQRAKAMQVLEDSVERHPGDRDSLLALVNFSRADGEPAKALRYAEKLAKIEPDNQQLAALIQTLRREVSKQAE